MTKRSVLKCAPSVTNLNFARVWEHGFEQIGPARGAILNAGKLIGHFPVIFSSCRESSAPSPSGLDVRLTAVTDRLPRLCCSEHVGPVGVPTARTPRRRT